MSYQAQVFGVSIASPSDVPTERELAARTVQTWNDLNSKQKSIVLLPIRSETHAYPEYGRHPQDAANEQFMDRSDILVGVFWTRIGSPTQNADSGTLEEIERAVQAGKPVMLYFSRAPVPPDQIDTDQLEKLRAFKKRVMGKAWIEEFDDAASLRDKLFKQLDLCVANLVSSMNSVTTNTSDKLIDVSVHFHNPRQSAPPTQILRVDSNIINIENEAQIPDYKPSTDTPQFDNSMEKSFLFISHHNVNYYRHWANYLKIANFYYPISFQLRNQGRIGARDVIVEMLFDVDSEFIDLENPQKLPKEPSPNSFRADYLVILYPPLIPSFESINLHPKTRNGVWSLMSQPCNRSAHFCLELQ